MSEIQSIPNSVSREEAAFAFAGNPWSPAVRDPVLIAERRGRWTWPWAMAGTLLVACLAVGLIGVFEEAQQWLAQRTGTIAAYERAQEAEVFLSPGNWFTFSSFAMFALALSIAVVPAMWLHGRPVGDIWRYHSTEGGAGLFFKAAAAMLVVAALGSGIEYLRHPGAFKLRASLGPDYWGWVGIAVGVLLVQTLAEELVFRGYFLRVWGAVLPIRPLVVGVLILGFTSLHTVNSDFKRDFAYNFIAFLLIEIIYYWVLLRTGRLASTWGLHFANNLLAGVLLVTIPGTAPDMALVTFTDPVLAAGGSRLKSPMAYVELIVGMGLLAGLLSWRWSPLALPKAPLPLSPHAPPPQPAPAPETEVPMA